MLPKQPKRPKPTLSIYESTGESSVVRTPVGKAIDTAAMLSDYMDKIGADGKIIWNIFLMSWGFDKTLLRPTVNATIGGEVSVKRLNPKTAHRMHVITCFKNTTSAVSVDGANLQRWMDKHSSLIDFIILDQDLFQLTMEKLAANITACLTEDIYAQFIDVEYGGMDDEYEDIITIQYKEGVINTKLKNYEQIRAG
ncbi:unnamed protein product [Bemisia tabaci]|uniref:Uncharacterized protein n=1 Tax=Bemisia tabaci TaxID=7038 RepID=A0A9P0F4Q7_BEMTA|nr:unnamed protein product [Bemisia tabaci]